MRQGIAIAGNMLVDHVKLIRSYPHIGMLADIVDVQQSVGGCVPNTILDLAAMNGGWPLTAIGRVGRDASGAYVRERLAAAGVDTSQVRTDDRCGTSFSDAMCAQDTGERTFFHYRGANATFRPEDVDLSALNCAILHIGYLLLLDAFDAPDAEYGTVMARFLRDVQQQGIQTSIDVVSDSHGRFPEIVRPALRYCDYAIMNEMEGGAVSGIPSRDAAGRLLPENIGQTLRAFMACGVRKRAIIHCPEAGFCLDAATGMTVVPSLRLPDGYIKSSVGAGDAFGAGCLYAIHRGMSAEDMLRFASAAAATSLSAAAATSGVPDGETLLQIMNQWERAEGVAPGAR